MHQYWQQNGIAGTTLKLSEKAIENASSLVIPDTGYYNAKEKKRYDGFSKKAYSE